jgi:hypothetical protein
LIQALQDEDRSRIVLPRGRLGRWLGVVRIRFGRRARRGKQLEVDMAFCTVVEWDSDVTEALRVLAGNDAPPAGSLARIVGASDKGTYAIELWSSGEDARRFAESSAPALAQSTLPPPTRVDGFETSSLLLRAAESG